MKLLARSNSTKLLLLASSVMLYYIWSFSYHSWSIFFHCWSTHNISSM